MPVISNQWLRKRRPHWERLASLLSQADQTGLGQLSRAELQEMALLYRQVAADISVLRQDPTARTYAEHVNQLLARAHNIMYSRRKTSLATLFRFLRDDYPAIFQRQFAFVFAAFALSLAWAALGASVTLSHPAFMRHYVGPAMVTTMERHKMWTDSVVGVEPMASSFIMTNNLTVCFLTFAGGIIFGLGTLWLLYFNGMMLGVIGAACHYYHMSILLWSFVAPHGSLELPSIFIAGGAGLRLGYGMLFPGNLRWKDSVALGGMEATRLVSGIIPLLVIAGTLEGFFSPSHAPIPLKFTVGAVLFVLLNLWLFRPLKPAASNPAAPTAA
ncbi:MAG TPA: stage II sporulation protein M [Terracidiphilus sp.]|nr:stage II sporulation protein M [Terracidiphilus sp.]